MRRHLTYANVAATLALVFAMSGGALAAKHYMLTSTKQIKPSVLKQLRGMGGSRGASGAAGPSGSAGASGTSGATGPRGETGPAGPSGASEGTPVEQASGATILSDSAVGVRVAEGTFFDFQFFNTNTSDKITIGGVVDAFGKLEAWHVDLAPGQSAVSPSQAAQTRFLDVTVERDGTTDASSRMVHVTCGVADEEAAPANCIAAR